MTLGPLMVDLVGLTLTEVEKEVLQHPLVGGVILFTRNYESPEQVAALTASIRALREPNLLIAVDHEGGRVQRFREGFTRLPPIGALGQHFHQEPDLTLQRAEKTGWLMAAEVRSVGIDFSFAPVLDLDYGVSEIIGDRSFHRDAQSVSIMAKAYIAGMKRAGMAAIGKHFPGHGAVEVDSHLGLPIDTRDFEAMIHDDILPFAQLGKHDLAGIMPAHIVYEKMDSLPAGFSPFWIQTILRQQLGFNGAVLSDDLSMEGAAIIGGSLERAEAAMEAGCDMVLVCNKPDSVVEVIDGLKVKPDAIRHQRLLGLKAKQAVNRADLLTSPEWKQAVDTVLSYAPNP